MRRLCRTPPADAKVELIKGEAGTVAGRKEVLPGVTAVKAGGHFPGSLLLHWERKLWIADTIVTVPVRLPSLSPGFPSTPENRSRHKGEC